MLKEKKVTVNGTEYSVRELTIGQMLPLMEKLQGDESSKAQMEIVSLSVHLDDKPLGVEAKNLGFSTYMGLTSSVMAINGMGDEGND